MPFLWIKRPAAAAVQAGPPTGPQYIYILAALALHMKTFQY